MDIGFHGFTLIRLMPPPDLCRAPHELSMDTEYKGANDTKVWQIGKQSIRVTAHLTANLLECIDFLW